MLTSQNCNMNRKLVGYEAAEGDLASPDSGNPYLQTILMPSLVSGVPIPDGDPTPVIIKQFSQEFVANWQNVDATLMVVWTPASPNSILKIFVRIEPNPWGHLVDLPLSQPLSESFMKARLISARLDGRSAAQAAGVFTLAGMASGIYTNQIPPFSTLNYNTLISYAPNAGSIAKQIPVCDGITSVFPPNRGSHEFFTPETNFSYNFKELWDYNFIGTPGGWLPSPFNIPANSSVVAWDSSSAQPFGYPFGNIPDPFYGNYRITLHDSGLSSVAGALKANIKIQYYQTDPITWVAALVTATLDSVVVPTTQGDFILDTGVLYTPYNIVRVFIDFQSSSGLVTTYTRRANFAPITTVISYDYYRPNVMSPVCISMLNRLNVNQPVSITGTYNYELVPNPILARNISVSTNRAEDINLESALVVLQHVGRGINLIWNTKDYDRAVLDATLKSFTTGSTAYQAAGPGLKSRLLNMWRAINPHLSQAGLAAGKAGLSTLGTALSTAYPALAPVVGGLSAAYLCAPVEEPELHIEEVIPHRSLMPHHSKLGHILFPRDLPQKNKTIPKNKKTCDHDSDKVCCDCCPANSSCVVEGKMFACPADYDNVTYHAADVESDYKQQSYFGTDFVNIVNGNGKPLATPRSAYFPIVPDPTNLNAPSLIVQIVFSTYDLGHTYQTVPVSGLTVHYSTFFAGERFDFLQQLILYGVKCGILTEKDLYIGCSHDTLRDVKGPSWQLAAFVALMGISGSCLYTGGIEFVGLSVRLKPVGQLATKMELAGNAGMKLVFPTPSDESLQTLVRYGDIVFPGWLCSGGKLSTTVVGLCIDSPFDVIVFNLRVMKHRVQMNPFEQALVAPEGKIKPRQPKVENSALIGAKEEGIRTLSDRYERALEEVTELVGANHDVAKSLRSKKENWIRAVKQCGDLESVEVQVGDISKTMGRAIDSAKKVREVLDAQAQTRKGPGKKGKNKSDLLSIKRSRAPMFYQKVQDQSVDLGKKTPPSDFEDIAAAMF